MKKLFPAIVLFVVLVGAFFALDNFLYKEKQARTTTDHLDAEYVIEGERVKLEDGLAETRLNPDSASTTITQYFGNELVTDLDGDGDDDIAFILTQTTGGSGVFYYAVSALNTEDGHIGSDGYLLGDRIAPQTTEVSPNPRHKNVIVFNYADRASSDPMTTEPSVGKSVYLKIDPVSMQWGIVEPDFEGESNQQKEITSFKWDVQTYNNEEIPDSKVYLVLDFSDGTSDEVLVDEIDAECNTEDVEIRLALDSEQITCYHAGLGHKFRVIEEDEQYLVQQKTFEEASPYNEGQPISKFETKLIYSK